MRLEYFQLIDRIAAISLTEGTIRTEATVPLESTIFEGHFPGRPLMPGVLLIEAMAQTCGWLLIAITRLERMPFLMEVRRAKFRRFVSPGEMLSVSGTLEHEGSGFAVANADGSIDGKPVCEAEVRFRLVPFPDETFRATMIEAAKRVGLPLEARADG